MDWKQVRLSAEGKKMTPGTQLRNWETTVRKSDREQNVIKMSDNLQSSHPNA